MNYNQHMTPDISNQNPNKISQMLGDQFRKLLDKTTPERETIRPEVQDSESAPSQRRTSEDDRLEALGYNY